jgi:hypothetical protein
MTVPSVLTVPAGSGHSVFAGVDVCHEAGLALPCGVRRPLFEDDLWDLAEVVGLPVQLALQHRRFHFALVGDPRWRTVAKELVMALLAPQHEAVASLSRAYRAPHHVGTCHGRLAEFTRFTAWLTTHGVTSLEDLTDQDCDAYLAHRRYQRDKDGAVVGERGPGTRRLAALIVTDLVNYRDLFTADRVPAGLHRGAGATPSDRRGHRQTEQDAAEPEAVLQPLLAAALHLVDTAGPHAPNSPPRSARRTRAGQPADGLRRPRSRSRDRAGH